MPTDARRRAFRKRWNIQLDEPQELARFKNRLIMVLQSTFDAAVPYSELHAIDKRFCYWSGEPLPSRKQVVSGWNGDFAHTRLHIVLSASESLGRLIQALQAMFWALEEHTPDALEPAVEAVSRAIRDSLTIDLRIVLKQGKATLYAAGARMLDDALVNDTLAWLEGYPKVAKHFDEALRIYLHKDASKYRNLLDNLRFSLEQLLRSILHNRKSLENQKEPILSWLKERGAHQQIINMYQTLLVQFTQYQNDAVKHGEAFSSSEIEFIIYLTGAFMRFVLQLHEEGSTASPVGK